MQTTNSEWALDARVTAVALLTVKHVAYITYESSVWVIASMGKIYTVLFGY